MHTTGVSDKRPLGFEIRFTSVKVFFLFYTRFQFYVYSGYLSTSFDIHLSTSSFDLLFEISQSQPMHADVCFMSLLCKWATSSKGHVSGLWLVDFDPSCLLSLSKDGWRNISAMHVTLKAGMRYCHRTLVQRVAGNFESFCRFFYRLLIILGHFRSQCSSF